MLVQIQEQRKEERVKLSQLLKNATEEQCFGQFMKISEIADLDKDCQTISIKSIVRIVESIVNVCVNGLLMSKAGIRDVFEYVADDDDILNAYKTLGFDPYYRIKCNKCNLLGDGYHLYRVLEHMNDHHRAPFKEIASYLETLGL